LSQQNSSVKNGHRSYDNLVALCCHPSVTLGCKFQLLRSTEGLYNLRILKFCHSVQCELTGDV